jgi:hypothetical protein
MPPLPLEAGVEAAALLPPVVPPVLLPPVLPVLPQPARTEAVIRRARVKDKNFFMLVPLFFVFEDSVLESPLHIIQERLSYFKGFSILFSRKCAGFRKRTRIIHHPSWKFSRKFTQKNRQNRTQFIGFGRRAVQSERFL